MLNLRWERCEATNSAWQHAVDCKTLTSIILLEVFSEFLFSVRLFLLALKQVHAVVAQALSLSLWRIIEQIVSLVQDGPQH